MTDLFSHHAAHRDGACPPPPEDDRPRWEPRVRHPLVPQVLDHDEMLANHSSRRRSEGGSSGKGGSGTLIARNNIVRRYIDDDGYEVLVVRRPKASKTAANDAKQSAKLDAMYGAKRSKANPVTKTSVFAGGMRNVAAGLGGLALSSVGGIMALSGVSSLIGHGARGGGLGGILIVAAGACVAILGVAMISAVWKEH